MDTSALTSIATIIPAAGASRRLGRPKQLERIHGLTLLRRTATIALEAGLGPVIIVLGAETTHSFGELRDLPCEIAEAPDWQEGIAASIRAGISRAAGLGPKCPGDPEVSSFLILLVDQYQITSADLRNLAESHRASGKPMTASAYDDTIGVPAIFDRTLLPDLLLLKGDQGARQLLRSPTASVNPFPLPHAAVDLDR